MSRGLGRAAAAAARRGVRRDRAGAARCCCRGSPPRSPRSELWTLPGGGIDFGEHPDDAVVREVYEETGPRLPARSAPVDRLRPPRRRPGESAGRAALRAHRVRRLGRRRRARAAGRRGRRVHRGRALVPGRGRRVGRVPTVPMVREALAHHWPAERQRLAAYALVRRDDALLLTRHSARGPRPGTWTLPGGGLDHGEPPAVAVAREVVEETGLVATVGSAARRARRALHRHRAARPRGGLPRRPPGLRSRGRPVVSRGCRTSRAPPTRWPGSPWPTIDVRRPSGVHARHRRAGDAGRLVRLAGMTETSSPTAPRV